MTLLFLAAVIVVLVWLLVGDRLLSGVHVTTVIIERPSGEVWAYVSDPLKFPRLYPKWVSRIEQVDEHTFRVQSPHVKEPYEISVSADEAAGTIDIEIGREVSRTRVIPLDQQGTAVVHVGTRWEDFNWFLWVIYKFNVDFDFRNAKSTIERERRLGASSEGDA